MSTASGGVAPRGDKGAYFHFAAARAPALGARRRGYGGGMPRVRRHRAMFAAWLRLRQA